MNCKIFTGHVQHSQLCFCSYTLEDIKVKYEHKMNNIENRMDNLEVSTKQEIKTSVSAMKIHC